MRLLACGSWAAGRKQGPLLQRHSGPAAVTTAAAATKTGTAANYRPDHAPPAYLEGGLFDAEQALTSCCQHLVRHSVLLSCVRSAFMHTLL